MTVEERGHGNVGPPLQLSFLYYLTVSGSIKNSRRREMGTSHSHSHSLSNLQATFWTFTPTMLLKCFRVRLTIVAVAISVGGTNGTVYTH